jgi:phosphoglycerol transferase MdoB-like AlkP superfamily enzyme
VKHYIYIDVVIFTVLVSIKLLALNFMIGGMIDMKPALFISVIGSVLMLAGLMTLLPQKPRLLVLFLLDCFISFVTFADTLFYRYFSDVLSMPILTQASNVSSVKSSVFSLIHIGDLGLILDIIIAIPVIVLVLRKHSSVRNGFFRRLAATAITIVLGFVMAYSGVAILLKSQPSIFKSFYDRVYIVQNIGLLNFHAIDAYKFAQGQEKVGKPVTEAEKEQIKQFLLDKKHKLPQNPRYYGEGKGKNI